MAQGKNKKEKAVYGLYKLLRSLSMAKKVWHRAPIFFFRSVQEVNIILRRFFFSRATLPCEYVHVCSFVDT